MIALIIIGAIILWLLGVVLAYLISLKKDEQTSFLKIFLMSLFITPVLLVIVEELKPYAPKEEVEEKKILVLNQNQQSSDTFWEDALNDPNF